MLKIFQYLDYRHFLKDRFFFLKKTRRAVTHRALCKRAGFSSPNFLKLVMDGKRNLTEQSIPAVCRAFELDEKESNFFKALVFFNQAKKVEQKDLAYDELKNIRRDLGAQHIEHSQMDYLEHWYHVAIRELVQTVGFKEDPVWMSQALKNKITPSQAKKSLELLEKLGLIARDKSGKIHPLKTSLSTGNEVASLAAFRFHQAMMEKAQEALKETPSHERDISSLTLAVSEKTFYEIKTRIQNFRKEILAMLAQENQPDSIYQLNFQFFNLTENIWKKSSNSF